MPNTCILVANAQRARFLQHDCEQGGLVEVAGFIYPAASTVTHASATQRGAPFEAQTAGPVKAYSRFARQLADYLNKAVDKQRCDGVALIATAPMLGAVRPLLSPRAHAKLRCSVDSDFTRYQGVELQQRVQDALGPGI
jgi:protein required for attachment to host cells